MRRKKAANNDNINRKLVVRTPAVVSHGFQAASRGGVNAGPPSTALKQHLIFPLIAGVPLGSDQQTPVRVCNRYPTWEPVESLQT